jgi:hypothetical protein
MRFASVTTLGLVLVVAADTAEAQLCAGNPSFASRPYQAAITAAFTEGAHGVGGEFGAGNESVFVNAGVSAINFRDLDAIATQMSLGVGTDLAMNQGQTVFACPLASISFGVGPDVGAFDVSTISLGGGVSLGVIASQANDLMIVPTFGLAAIYSRVTAELPADDFTESDSSGRVSVGVGFILNQNVGITPTLTMPFSADNADPIFGIRLSFAFGS